MQEEGKCNPTFQHSISWFTCPAECREENISSSIKSFISYPAVGKIHTRHNNVSHPVCSLPKKRGGCSAAVELRPVDTFLC